MTGRSFKLALFGGAIYSSRWPHFASNFFLPLSIYGRGAEAIATYIASIFFREPRSTAQRARSLPGFLYNWYQPNGKLGPAEMVVELTDLASRVLGLRSSAAIAPPPYRKRSTSKAAPAAKDAPSKRRKSAPSPSSTAA